MSDKDRDVVIETLNVKQVMAYLLNADVDKEIKRLQEDIALWTAGEMITWEEWRQKAGIGRVIKFC